MNNAPYSIDGLHIVDTKNSKRRFYIREIIEVGCQEFTSSKLSVRERLMIIECIGQERIFALMRESFQERGRTFIEGHDGLIDIQMMTDMAKKEVEIL